MVNYIVICEKCKKVAQNLSKLEAIQDFIS